MVSFWVVTCILATWGLVVAKGAQHHPNAPFHPPSAAADCNTLIYKMVDCMSYLSSGDNETKPEGSCCSGFKSVVKVDVECICEALKSSADLGIDLNMTKAFNLPSACGISTPALSSCNAPPPPKSPPVSTPPSKSPPVSAPPPKSPPVSGPPPKSPPASLPPPKSKKTPISKLPPTTTSPTPATPTTPGGRPANKAPAPSPTSSGAYTISTSYALLFNMAVASIFYILS